MRKIIIASAAALLCAAAFPAAAAPTNNVVGQDQVQNEQPTQQSRARDNGRRYCVRETMSNSRLARRVCYTQAQWDEMRRNGEADSDR